MRKRFAVWLVMVFSLGMVPHFAALAAEPEWTVVENDAEAVTYSENGGWGIWPDAADSGGSATVSNDVAGNWVEFTFEGTAIQYVSRYHPYLGRVEVVLDGVSQGIFDLCKQTYDAYQQVIFEKARLRPGTHTIRVVLAGKSETDVNGLRLMLDCFRYQKLSSTKTICSVKEMEDGVSVLFQNGFIPGMPPVLLLAEYNSGVLVGTAMQSVEPEAEQTFVAYRKQAKANTLRAFLFQDLKTLVPLSAPMQTDVRITAESTGYQWKPMEFTFETVTVLKEDDSPWKNVQFQAECTAPDGSVLTIPGFWDGGSVFKLRFTATQPGTWHITTKCPQLMSLAQCAFSVNVLEPAADETNMLYKHGGFIKASENGRYLTYTDGTPFYYQSETLWYTPSDQYLPINAPASAASIRKMGREFFEEKGIRSAFNSILDDRQEKGFTVLKTGFLGYNTNISIQEEFHKTQKINVAFWQSADQYFASIMEHGMLQIAFPIWQGAEAGWADAEEWKELLDYMLARYGAYYMTYGMVPEYNGANKVENGLAEDCLELLRYVRSKDPYGRLLTAQPNPWSHTGNADKMEWPEESVGFLMLEGGHEDPYGIPTAYYNEAWEFKRDGVSVPSVLTETTWDGLVRNGYPAHDDYVIRYNQYRGWLSGAKGTDYGTQGLWYPVQHYDDHTFEDSWGATNVPWWDAVDKPSSFQVGYMKKLYETLEWWKLEPVFGAAQYNEKILPPDKGEGVAPAQSYCTASAATIDDGSQYLIYIPKTTENTALVSLRLASKKAGYRARWFDPREGTFIDCGTVSWTDSLTVPDRPDAMDWVLVLN